MSSQKITLDTNIIIYLAQCEGILPIDESEKEEIEQVKLLFEKLYQYRENGYCELAVSTAILRDTPSGDLIDSKLRDMIGSYVDLATPAPFEFELVFPVVFVNPDEWHRLFNDLYPDAKPNSKTSRHRKNDVRQLLGHSIAGRDIFITNDEKDILRNAEFLKKEWGIKVVSLEDYIEQIELE